ncbi:GTP 3',8-cyclase MoaA [Aquimarina sp. TRL1]|uniref:GTP 3',8-cyclase MoaA n=1 Tax=Aquimarina sp. (strain TRL1) TaxID=2736252 RepID=UPI0015899C48|nr:GTP 3',8-cyclase MoaA [Aquimarina sp. TRL1]QKX04017.1 GTP 3',8-cyclase MoaA [Aquimarina sp. TRL1]
MKEIKNILTDTHQRKHSYLRISLTERCNLRCTYCMPSEGVHLSPKSCLMTADEVYEIAKVFVKNGVTKIRLTGGEPLIRKDIHQILEKLASLPINLAITTNAVVVDRFIPVFKRVGIRDVNVSLDSLNERKFKDITRRNYFDRVYTNIFKLLNANFHVKINIVLIKGFNEDEIINFIRLTKDLDVTIRFIEFMPFDGNRWNIDKMVSYQTIMKTVKNYFSERLIVKEKDAPNDTAVHYKIGGYTGKFAIISSVTNPFCDSCNRIRITANGYLKNCLFSATESDLLSPLREGKSIESIIQKSFLLKEKTRGGMNTLEELKNPVLHTRNRSMTIIGG